ncbi:tyrosine-type recombinase/integrase [Roseivivax sp. CAU 1753]
MDKITQRTIASLTSTGTRTFVRDGSLTGFGIEVTAKGKATYIVETRVKGLNKTVRKHLGPVDLQPLAEAQQEARALLLEAKRGVDIRFLDDDDDDVVPDTLGEALEEHLKRKSNSLAASTVSDYRKTFKNALGDWKDLPTKQLTRGMVLRRYTELLGQHSGAYVDKTFRNLSATLSFHGVHPNPCKVIAEKGLKPAAVARERALTPREIHIVWQEYTTFKKRVARVLLFFMLTGLRRNEVLSLTWADIHSGHAHIRQTKNKKPHIIPLHGKLEELAGKCKQPHERVFGYTDNQLRTAFNKFKAEVNFHEDWTIHDLRRTFAADLQLLGYTVGEIGIATNHSPAGVTAKHYLGGSRNKTAILNRMYKDLQEQHMFYLYNDGDFVVRQMPENWEPIPL